LNEKSLTFFGGVPDGQKIKTLNDARETSIYFEECEKKEA